MVAATAARQGIQKLGPLNTAGDAVNIVIETPRGSRNKYAYDEQSGLFVLKGLLPAGAVFPFDFGFVPSTLAEDGDPLDVLVLMEEAAFVGCLVPSRLIGVIEADQTERDGKTTRNDRLVAVATVSRLYAAVNSLDDLDRSLIDEVEHFFVSYNTIKGKDFKPLGRFGPQRAHKLLEAAVASCRRGRTAQSATRKPKSG